jgi:hypothetical protein
MKVLTMTTDQKIFGELLNGSLEDLQRVVGGWVQAVQLSDTITLWINEEGKLDGLPFNHNATLVWEHFFGKGTDIVVGNAFFTGGVDKDGNSEDISESDFFMLKRLAVDEAKKFVDDHIKIIMVN